MLGRAGGWVGMRLGGSALCSGSVCAQELTTVRVQDPRVQNEGSWNSYVDYKIFLHVSCGCWETAELTCLVAPQLGGSHLWFVCLFCADQQQGLYSQDLMCATPVP